MKAKVLKPIPGASYLVGDEDSFDDLASQWLIPGGFIEPISDSKAGKTEKSKSKDSDQDSKSE